MNRLDISRLQKNRPIFLKVGMIISLAFAILAFNWTSSAYENEGMYFEGLPNEPEVEVIRTSFEQPRQLPPPMISPSEEALLVETPEFTNSPTPPTLDAGLEFKEVVEAAEYTPQVNYNPPALPVVEEQEEGPGEIFKIVEEMPRFGDCAGLPTMDERESCSNHALLQYIYQRIRYPEIARSSGIEGTVVIQFVIEKDGSVSNTRILRDIGGGCGQEALRIAKVLPKWTPGAQRGRPVRVRMNLPVKFQLK